MAQARGRAAGPRSVFCLAKVSVFHRPPPIPDTDRGCCWLQSEVALKKHGVTIHESNDCGMATMPI